MKKQNRKVAMLGLVFAMSLFTMTSCSTSSSALNDLQNFSNELRDNSQNYDAKDWSKAVNKFGKIRKKISKHDYTVAERQRIGKLEGDCAKYMVKGAKEGVMDGILGLGSEIQGVLDAIGTKK